MAVTIPHERPAALAVNCTPMPAACSDPLTMLKAPTNELGTDAESSAKGPAVEANALCVYAATVNVLTRCDHAHVLYLQRRLLHQKAQRDEVGDTALQPVQRDAGGARSAWRAARGDERSRRRRPAQK